MNQTNHPLPKSKRKFRRRAMVLAACMMGIGLWFLPHFIARTSLRDAILTRILNAPDYDIYSQNASLGWLTPLSVEGLTIEKRDRSVTLRIRRLQSEKSWLAIWLSQPDLGAFNLEQPIIEVISDAADSSTEPDFDLSSLPNLTAVIHHGHIVVRTDNEAEPEIDVESIDLTVHLERIESISVLRIDQLEVLDHVELDEQLCRSGLRLIAPLLAEEVDVRGNVSLELETTCLPLVADETDFDRLVEFKGCFRVHQLSSQIKNPITLRLVRMFAEMLDLGEVPDEWNLAKDTEVRFHFLDGRIFHQGFSMILPEVTPDFSVAIEGSVSLEEMLDMVVTVRLPRELLGDSPLAQEIAKTEMEVRVFGTIDEPQLGLTEKPSWIFDLTPSFMSDQLTKKEKQLADDFLEIIGQLHANDPRVSIPPEILRRFKLHQGEEKKK